MTGEREDAVRRGLLALVAFQGVSGLVGGAALVADPSGSVLEIPLAWLRGSPFDDYLVPGLVLFSVLGLVPLAVAYGLWIERAWARAGSLFVGIALGIWLAVEIATIGYVADPPFQLLYGVVATAIVGLALTRLVRS